jgi:hypothetical protein
MKQVRTFVKVVLDELGLPLSGSSPFKLSQCNPWFKGDENTSSPIAYKDFDGVTRYADVAVYDPTFVWFQYIVDGHEDNSIQPIFSFVKTRTDGTGLLFTCMNDNGTFRDDLESVFNQFMSSSVTLLPSSSMTTNEKFVNIA